MTTNNPTPIQQGETLELCANCGHRIVLIGNKWLHSDRVLLGPENSRQCWLFAARRAAALAGPRKYFCSCGGALTAEEYIVHYFEMGHDRAEGYELVTENQLILNRAQELALKVMSMSDPPTTTKGDR